MSASLLTAVLMPPAALRSLHQKENIIVKSRRNADAIPIRAESVLETIKFCASDLRLSREPSAQSTKILHPLNFHFYLRYFIRVPESRDKPRLQQCERRDDENR